MPKNDDEKGEKKNGTKDINGQIEADREFKERAERLLARLRSRKKPAEGSEGAGEKTKDVTDKHK